MQKQTKAMPKKIDRRTMILLTLLVLLVASSYANYRLGVMSHAVTTSLPVARVLSAQPTATPTAAPVASGKEASSFAEYRTQRSQTRAQEIQMLDAMIADTAAGADMTDQARAQKLTLVKSMEQETSLEGLLRAKGFGDVVVSAKPGAVTVVVAQAQLTQSEATQIMELTTHETGVAARDVKIIPAK